MLCGMLYNNITVIENNNNKRKKKDKQKKERKIDIVFMYIEEQK